MKVPVVAKTPVLLNSPLNALTMSLHKEIPRRSSIWRYETIPTVIAINPAKNNVIEAPL